MEKFIKSLSTIITAILFYTIASFLYLSGKGFVFENGTFVFVKEAKASADRDDSFAHKIDENIAINFSDDKSAGNKNAPLTMYEFSSLGCGHCADFHLNILPLLKQDFIDTTWNEISIDTDKTFSFSPRFIANTLCGLILLQSFFPQT